MKKSEVDKKQKAANVIQQMVDDKRSVQKYFQENGTLKGFKSDSVKFAKPF